MKKLLCLILTITMLAGLTGCGETRQVQGKKIFASAKGINTKTITLKLSGTLPEGTEPHIGVPFYGTTDSEGNSGQDPLLAATQKSSKTNYVEYKISALKPGTGSSSVYFIKDDKVAAKIDYTVSVDEKLKINSFTMVMDENPVNSTIDLGDGTNASITALDDSDFVRYSFEGAPEDWIIKNYDRDVVSVNGPIEDGENSAFNITAIGEGETCLELVSNLGKKVYINLASEKKDSDSEIPEYVLTTTEIYSEDYEELITKDQQIAINNTTVTETQKDENGNKIEVQVKKEIISGFSLPADAKVKEMNNYAYGNRDNTSVPDTIDCSLVFKDTELYYTATKALTLDSYLSEMKNDVNFIIESEEEFVVNNKNIKLLRTGFTTALWEDNDTLYILIMLTENADNDKALVESFLNAI